MTSALLNPLIPKSPSSDLLSNLHGAKGTSKKYPLFDLLPYDPSTKKGKRAVDGIKEYLLLLKALFEAKQAFVGRQFSLFDPLVGENFCQIRALQLFSIIKAHPKLFQEADSHLLKVIETSQHILDQKEKIAKTAHSLEEYLDFYQLDIYLSKEELFLVTSYLLTKVKASGPLNPDYPLFLSEKTNTKKIKEISPVGSMFADSFIKNLRKRLAKTSVDFVQNLARLMQVEKHISSHYIKEHRGLSCLPYYWTTQVLIEYAKKQELPILLIAQQKEKAVQYSVTDEKSFLYRVENGRYQCVPIESIDQNTPALILIGARSDQSQNFDCKQEWIKNLLSKDPTDLVLAYAAAHRQYPDSSSAPYERKPEALSYHYYKKQAFQWGCSADNPSLFFLSHAFCDTIENGLLRLESTSDKCFSKTK